MSYDHLLKSWKDSNPIHKKYILPCPSENCKGFVDTSYSCELVKICKQCYEIKLPGHTCSRDSIESTDMIKQSTKPCPKCFVPIVKGIGCDQMFCTNYNTSFYYSSLQIVKKNIPIISNGLHLKVEKKRKMHVTRLQMFL